MMRRNFIPFGWTARMSGALRPGHRPVTSTGTNWRVRPHAGARIETSRTAERPAGRSSLLQRATRIPSRKHLPPGLLHAMNAEVPLDHTADLPAESGVVRL